MDRRLALLILMLGASLVVLSAFLGGGNDKPEAGPTDAGVPTKEPRLLDSSEAGPKLATTTEGQAAKLKDEQAVGTLLGRVLDGRRGEGIPGAMVIAFSESVRIAASHKDGSFELKGLGPGSWWLLAWHPQYVPAGIDDLLKKSKREASAEALQLEVPADGMLPTERVIRLHPGRRIEGRVVDAYGRPVAGARVRLEDGSWRYALQRRLGVSLWGWEKYVPFRSDPEGRFVIACLPEGFSTARLGALGEGTVSRWSEAISLDPAEPPEQVELQLLATASVSGRVLGPDGKPVVTALVTLDWSGEDPDDIWAFDDVGAAEVDAEGRYTISGLPPDALSLEARWLDPYMSGVPRELAELGPGEHRRGFDLTLPRRNVLRARLVDGGGRALPGERVEVREIRDGPKDNEDESVFDENEETDEEGAFEFAIPVAGPVEVLHLMPSGLDRVLAPRVELPAGGIEYVSEAAPRTRIDLRVTDAAGNPISRYESAIWSLAGDEKNEKRNKQCFDSNVDGERGFARHQVLGEAPFSISVQRGSDVQGRRLPLADRLLEIGAVPPGGVVEIRLCGTDQVHGRIVDEAGRAVVGVRVSFLWSERWGDGHSLSRLIVVAADGRFAFKMGDPVDGYAARIELQIPEGYVSVPSYRPDPKEGERTIVLRRGGAIAGRVRSPSPLGALEDGSRPAMWVSWEGAREWIKAPISEDGSWRAVGVPEGLDLEVMFERLTAMYLGYRPPPVVNGVRAGRKDIEIQLVEGARIAGRYLDPGGLPPKGKLLLIASPLDSEAASDVGLAKVSPVDGSFTLGGLASGSYRLYLHDRQSRFVRDHRVVEAGQEGLSITLPRRGSIRVTLEGTDPESASIEFWDSGTTFRRGSGVLRGSKQMEFQGVPGGRAYDLVVSDMDGAVGARGGVRIGEGVTIHIVEAKPLNGRLRRADGGEKPFSGELFALTDGACFDLMIGEEGGFDATWDGAGVVPGRYELRYVARDGTTQIVARDVEAGTEDLDLVLK